jgi:thiamine-monophosphate kinase
VHGLDEFGLIARYFTHSGKARRGVGDDCALIDVGNHTLALTSDMLVEGVHFFSDDTPADIAHKALAVNLSDLAAAGAEPRCFLLDLALPQLDPAWLQAFSGSLMQLARYFHCDLIGGDTTQAPATSPTSGALVIAITAIGEVPRDDVRGRDGARAGDDVWVSGELGDAALAVRRRYAQARGAVAAAPLPDSVMQRLTRPQPRIALGMGLRGLASAAADISDGLVGDLGHILTRSGCGARIDWRLVPHSQAVAALALDERQAVTLAGGDDYELVFTADPSRREQILALSTPELPLTCIGSLCQQPGLHWSGLDGTRCDAPSIPLRPFTHFSGGTHHDRP